MTTGTTGAPLRSDARRNRERLVEAALKVFVAEGVGAPLDAIAREAGVGNATMYRNFPTREDILEAVLCELHAELGRRAQELLLVNPPGGAFAQWLGEFLEHTQSLLGLPEPLEFALRDEGSALYASCADMRVYANELFARAQSVGEIRPDVSPDDVFAHALGIAWATQRGGDNGEQAGRLLGVLLDGIREAPTPVPR